MKRVRLSSSTKRWLDRFVMFGRRTSNYWGTLPFKDAVRFAYLDFRSSGREVQLTWAGYRHPITVRAGTSDVRTFCHVIAADGYEQKVSGTPSVIVDAGAHIGLASVWYANRYPDARVIALEPEPANFDLLCRNTTGFTNVTPIRAALWKSSGSLRLLDPGQGTWAFRVSPSGESDNSGESVPSVCIDDLMATHGIDHIDVLKVDIEGSEREVFEHSAGWIDRVGAIAIELHDRFEPGCGRAFYAATSGFVDEMSRDEDVFAFRPRS